MKIKINKDALNKAVMFLMPGIPSKAIIPVEDWIHFDIKGDKCTASICNSRVEMTAFLKVENPENVEKQFCVTSQTFSRLIATFPDGEINITMIDDEDHGIKKIKLKPKTKSKNYQIGCVPAKQFSKWDYSLDDHDAKFTVNMKELNDKMKIVGPNIPVSDLRAAFGNLTLFSNHNNALSLLSGQNEIISRVDVGNVDFHTSRIVDHRITRYISYLTDNGDCEITITKNKFHLSYSGMTICCLMVNEKVPGYQALFDKDPAETVSIEREEFLNSLQRLGAFNAAENRISIQIKSNSLRLYSENFNDSAEEIMDVDNSHGLDIDIDMNLMYLKQSIAAIKSERINFGIGRENVAIFIKPSSERKDNQLWMFGRLAKKRSSVEE